jgi:hypothetical protein
MSYKSHFMNSCLLGSKAAKGLVARVTTFKKYNIACIFCN